VPGGDYQRILLIKPSSLGDLVHAMPTLAALRDRFPAASFTWLVKSQWAGLVERMEGVDEVWPVPPGLSGWLSQVPRLRAARFDLVIDLQGLLRSGAMSWLAGCPVRIGLSTAREGSRWFYTDEALVETPDLHAVDRNLLVARALGAAVPSTPAFRFRSSEQDRTAAAALLEREGIRPGEAWIAMNVAARWPTKRWPPESFARAADGLHKEGLGRVVLVGGPDERAEAGKALFGTIDSWLIWNLTAGARQVLFQRSLGQRIMCSLSCRFAQPHPTLADGDGSEPGAEPVGCTAGVNPFERLNERFLADILGIGTTPADCHGNSEGGAIVTSHQ